MRTVMTRQFNETVYRKKITDSGEIVFTKEIPVDKEEFLEADRNYLKNLKIIHKKLKMRKFKNVPNSI